MDNLRSLFIINSQVYENEIKECLLTLYKQHAELLKPNTPIDISYESLPEFLRTKNVWDYTNDEYYSTMLTPEETLQLTYKTYKDGYCSKKVYRYLRIDSSECKAVACSLHEDELVK